MCNIDPSTNMSALQVLRAVSDFTRTELELEHMIVSSDKVCFVNWQIKSVFSHFKVERPTDAARALRGLVDTYYCTSRVCKGLP